MKDYVKVPTWAAAIALTAFISFEAWLARHTTQLELKVTRLEQRFDDFLTIQITQKKGTSHE